MAKTIMDLFKEQKGDIYGLSSTVLIETRGIVNPPRQAALLLASPNAIADLIGSAGSQFIGGNANRPSDTIFKDNKPLTKPISLTPTVAQLRNAVEPNQSYFVKTEPSPGANIAGFIKSAVQSPAAAQTAAIQLVTKLGSKNALQDVKDYYTNLKGIKRGLTYGPKNGIGANGKVRDQDYKYSTHYPMYAKSDDSSEYVKSGITPRGTSFKNWDLVNGEVLKIGKDNTDGYISDSGVDALEKTNNGLNQTYVKFSLYGKEGNIILPGTISGLSEDFAPEWNSFKYVGSPFNIYRYGGVERTLKFDVKMYYTDPETKTSMINNLNRLRKLVFPDEDISVVTYPGNDKRLSQLFFTPNLVYLTINGLYEKLLGIVDTLSFSIDDNTSWATAAEDIQGKTNTKPYPTVINVSLGMKIIEHPAINKDNKFVYGDSTEGTNQYVNYFTGVKH